MKIIQYFLRVLKKVLKDICFLGYRLNCGFGFMYLEMISLWRHNDENGEI